ncbi:MAG: hypothetical protein Q8936_01095 [Bacillota bacterium]|nr:hypothetical protein [Bacillota bacterium]
MTVPQILISDEAYNKLLELLEIHSEYTHIRFSYIKSCCKSSAVDIYLDQYNENYIESNFNSLKILLEEKICSKIKTIELIYKNNGFMVKTESLNPSNNSCNKGCSTGSQCECDGCNCGK